jgi:hypothetical protein
MRGVEVRAHAAVELGRRHLLGHRGGLALRATIHPDHGGPEGSSVTIAHHHAVQLRPERQPLDGRRTLGQLVEQLPDAAGDGRGPQIRVLFRAPGNGNDRS